MARDGRMECAEVSGKTIAALTINQNPMDGTEVQIDFTDGTSLSLCVSNRQHTDASLIICGGAGEPETIRKYELD